MAVMSESSSSFFSFSFFTRLSMARLAKPSFSPPCRWHIRLWTMLRQASLLLGGFTDMMLYDATGHKSKACYLWTHNVHSDQLILALDRYSNIRDSNWQTNFSGCKSNSLSEIWWKTFSGKIGKVSRTCICASQDQWVAHVFATQATVQGRKDCLTLHIHSSQTKTEYITIWWKFGLTQLSKFGPLLIHYTHYYYAFNCSWKMV